MTRNPARLLVLLVLILAVFSFPQMIQQARAQTPGVVCIGPDLPGQIACPSPPVALTGPVSTTPATQIRLQVFIQATDPMNGFDITLLADHTVLVPVGIDLTGTILGSGTTTLAECLQGVLVSGTVCQSSDTIDTLHLAVAAAPGFLTPAGASGALFTAIYNIVSASPGLTVGYQNDANDGLTNCATFSVPGTCVSISNGTTTPVPETVRTGTFSSSSTQPFLQMSPGSTPLGNTFPGLAIPLQTIMTADMNEYGAWQQNGGVGPGDTFISYVTTVTPPSTGATGLSFVFGGTNPQDFSTSPGSVSNTLQLTSAATTTNGVWAITVTGTYHFDPNCAVGVGCSGPASTLVESVTFTVNIEDFTYTIGGSTTSTFVPFWCPAANQGAACPGGQSGAASISVTPRGYTGTVTLANGIPSPATSPALAASLSTASIPGASGTSTDTFSAGLLRPTTAAGSYSVAVTATGTLAANGAFGPQTKVKTVSVIVRPQDFNVTTSNGTPTGPSLSFAAGSSTSDTLTLGSLPSGSAAVNAAGFVGSVTLSSLVTGGSGLTVTLASNTVTLVGGQKLNDLVTFGGTVSTTTTFSVTITGTATLATSNPSIQTHSVMYSVTITAIVTTHPTSTTVTCTTPVVINQGSTCSVTVTDTSASGATAPTGTVSLGQTGVTGTFTPCNLSGATASATCTSTFTASTSGSASVTASYPGDSTHDASSGTASIAVDPRATTTTVSCTTPVSTGQGSTCNVTVTDTSPGTFIPPIGTVALSETGVTGSFTACTLVGTTSAATCSSTFTASTSGTAAVTASYPGDTTHGSSSGTTSIIVNPAIHTTTTSVTCTTPVVINQGSTCTVTVADTSATGATTPTGTVGLTQAGVTGSFTTCSLSGTTASAICTSTFTATTSGTASVTASYPGDTTHAASGGTASIVVNPRATTTTVTCTTPVVISQGSTCDVTVTDTSAGTFVTPSGTVTLSETGVTGSFTTCILTGTAASATCTSTFTGSTSGTAAVTADYLGDTSHGASSGTASIVVNIRPTNTTVTCSPASISPSQTTTCTATVNDPTTTPGTQITPTGTVTFTSTGAAGTFTGSPCTLVAGTLGTASCQVTFTAGTGTGNANIVGTYNGDSAHSPSASTAFPVTIGLHVTTTTVSCATPVVINQGSACSVTVMDTSSTGATTPTGTVSLSETGVTGSFTTCTLSGTTATAVCTSTFTASTSGTASVTATYAGDSTHGGSQGTTSIVIDPRTTTTTISCISPVVVNQGSACDVTVTDTSPGTAITPTGTISLGVTGATGSFTACTLAGTTASATCSSTFIASTSGTADVTADYPGDSTHSSSSGTTSVVVNPRTTTTSVSCTTPVNVNSGSACNVTVTDTSSVGSFVTPTGTVALSETGVTGTFTTCSLSGTTASASCTSTFTATTAGTASISADYPGDSAHSSSSGTTSVVVNQPAANTSTTVSCTGPVLANEGASCTVTVTDTSSTSATTPTGTVTLTETGVTGSFTTCTLAGTTASATCTSTFTATTSGTAAITAAYTGDTTHAGSSGTTSVTVNPRITTTTVSCTSPVNTGQGSTCNVTVTDTSTAGTFLTPTGTVALSETGVTGTFTTCTLAGTTASATCSSTFTASTAGTAAVTASYPGDTAHDSSSGTDSITVNAVVGVPTVTVNSPTPNPADTSATVTVTFTVTSTATVTGITVNWGDGTAPDSLPGTATSDTHTYASTGNAKSQIFTIVVTATNSAGPGSDTTTETVNDQPPTVSIVSILPNPVNTGSLATVTFTSADPDGTVSSISVDWGDSTTADTLPGTATSDTHAYTTGGSFTITITATDNSGSTGAATGSITVTVPVGVPTVTVNSPTPNPAITGETVTVTFTVSSTDTVTGIMVNWGDGTTPNTLSGTATSDTHVYASTGASTSETFTITVTATNSAGPGSGTTTENVNDRPPVASFTFTPSSPSAGQTVSFDASASADPDGTIISYAWNFGDGTTGTDVTPTHTYSPATTTTFTVMLTVNDNSGSTGSTSQSITITVTAVNPPVVTITGVVPNPANTGQTVNLTFTVSSTATVTGITVNWGDGTVSDSLPGTATSDTHNYANTGNAKSQTFTITVTATNSGGAGLATTTETVNDRPPIVTISTVTPNPASTGQTVTVSFSATDPDGTISSITINWGDSSTPDTLGGTATSDTHSYTTAGNFTITITATDNSGSAGAATALERVTTVSTTPIVLTFQVFNFTAFHNGFGSFQVLVNGHVVDVVNIPFARSATISRPDSAPGANRFVNFGPFDITSFVILGQNNVTFVNPTTSHFSLVRNVLITQGSTIFLNVTGARFVSPGHLVTFTFSNPPLTITSFTISNNNPFVEQHVTLTATYTGGTGPFKCLFRFGNGNLWGVKGNAGSCSVTTDYDFPGTFTATLRITGSTTADRQTVTLPTDVNVEPDPVFVTTSQDIASQSQTASNLQSFSFKVLNPSSHTVTFRVDTLVTRPDQTNTWRIGQSFTLQSGQSNTFSTQSYPSAGQHGTYNFKAALKFGIDTSNDGVLQNSEKIVTSGYLFGHFTVP